MKQFTDITVLLDRSGSMVSIREPMESAFNEFITKHKEIPSTKITLVQFDSTNDQETVYQCVPVGSVEKLKLVPRGDTPLIDAFVKVIDRTGERLSIMNEADRPDQVLMVIITDGQENASRAYTRKDVSSRVTKQTNDYKWQFIYLGANQDAIAEAASYGIGQKWALNYAASASGTASASAGLMANSMTYVGNTKGMRGTKAPEFTKEQRKKAEDK